MWFVIIVWPLVLSFLLEWIVSSYINHKTRWLAREIDARHAQFVALHREVDRLRQLVEQHEREKRSMLSDYD